MPTFRFEISWNCRKPQTVTSNNFGKESTSNLQAGRIRMVFVADVIPEELQRIIEFLNEQMRPAEVLGVEVRQYLGQSVRTLVPRVFGLTAEAMSQKGRATGTSMTWDEEKFLEQASERGLAALPNIRKLLDFTKGAANISYGIGKTATFHFNVRATDGSTTGIHAHFVILPRMGG